MDVMKILSDLIKINTTNLPGNEKRITEYILNRLPGYEDFIEMLRYYLNSQIPKVDIVNVVINNNGFLLYDHKSRKIENASIKSIIEEYKIDDLSKSDVLVSSLIVLAPNKVIVHIKNDNEKELMQILKKIFTDR